MRFFDVYSSFYFIFINMIKYLLPSLLAFLIISSWSFNIKSVRGSSKVTTWSSASAFLARISSCLNLSLASLILFNLSLSSLGVGVSLSKKFLILLVIVSLCLSTFLVSFSNLSLISSSVPLD